MTGMLELAARLDRDKPADDVLRFRVVTVQGKRSYSWGQVITTDEATARVLCDVWNNRKDVAAALRSIASMREAKT